jgi:hypothetical protein
VDVTLHLVRGDGAVPSGAVAEGDRVVRLDTDTDYAELIRLIFAAARVITW